jgi:hypothetical protein
MWKIQDTNIAFEGNEQELNKSDKWKKAIYIGDEFPTEYNKLCLVNEYTDDEGDTNEVVLFADGYCVNDMSEGVDFQLIQSVELLTLDQCKDYTEAKLNEMVVRL